MMYQFAIFGSALVILATILLVGFWLVGVEKENKNLKKENQALKVIADSLMSGRSLTPNPFPTQEKTQ